MSDAPRTPSKPEPDPSGVTSHAGGGGACAGCGHDHDHDHGHHHHHGHESVVADEAAWTRNFLLLLELVVLLLWAVMMVWIYASGRISEYLIGEGTFRIQVLVSGLLLAVLGFFNWQMRAIPGDCGHDHGPGESCGHDDGPEPGPGVGEAVAGGHHHEASAGGRGLALAVLAVSVAAAVALTPDEFSDQYKRNMLNAYSSRQASGETAPEAFRLAPQASTAGSGLSLATIEKYQPRNAGGNFELDVMQLYYSGADPEYAAVMKGQGVETIGQVVRDTASNDPARWRVFVLQMTCCAADARPFSLPVEFTGTVPDLQEMGWYKLVGTIDYVDERGVTVAVLKADRAEPSLRPKELRTLF